MKALTRLCISWTKRPVPCSLVFSSFISAVTSTTNAKSAIQSTTKSSGMPLPFISQNSWISVFRSRSLCNTLPRLSHLTSVWYLMPSCSLSCSSKSATNCLWFSVCDLIKVTASVTTSTILLSMLSSTMANLPSKELSLSNYYQRSSPFQPVPRLFQGYLHPKQLQSTTEQFLSTGDTFVDKNTQVLFFLCFLDQIIHSRIQIKWD